jgi:hypothetical protein
MARVAYTSSASSSCSALGPVFPAIGATSRTSSTVVTRRTGEISAERDLSSQILTPPDFAEPIVFA